MNTTELIDKLGYLDNPAFLQGRKLERHHGYSFFFKQASKKDKCNLKGVYALIEPPDKNISSNSLTPIVYVCEAENEKKAQEIHKMVWNQNIVPFLIVVTRKNIRVYPGFEYDQKKSEEKRVLAVVEDVNEILVRLSAFTSEAIDSGAVWEKQKISTEKRVDRHLLKNLDKLSEVLTGPGYTLSVEDAHILIGKYIYLKYLRDRGILSDLRLKEAGVSEEEVYSGNAQKGKLYQLEKYLDDFLNGSVFPLPSQGRYNTKHIQKVAGVFRGDDPESGQQVMFNMYDFSYVPIETLSVVYQQFLRQKEESRSKGAYYTPVHLVNFILDELDAKKPLKKGMAVFDPACGSGAFLVQCYRRMVERVLRGKREKLKPTELRSILVDNIFGLDADEEACRVAELSLSLTLLDYIEPPDLTKTKNFNLPDLHNKNIFYCEGGFFDEGSPWAESIRKGKEETKYDWIVGNPPWKNIDKKRDKELYDRKAIEWIDANKKSYPVDKYQLAEAFAWKTTELLAEEGQCGLLMPAMTLFKKLAKNFRGRFFSDIEVWCIVNFANLRGRLFEGAVNPAAAFFFSGKKEWDKAEHYITTYAPFAVEQSSQLNQKGRSKKLWTVLVNYSAIKEIPIRNVEDGSSVPWKMAMWGTHRDQQFVNSTQKHFSSLEEVGKKYKLDIRQGPALRTKNSGEEVEYIPELKDKRELDIKKMKGERNIFSIPEQALSVIPRTRCYLRKITGKKSLLGCKPPHIIVDAAMRFAIYSDEYIVINAKPVGITGSQDKAKLLKAIAMLLNSNFIKYMDIALSGYLGVERDRSGEKYVIESFPVPVESLFENTQKLAKLAKLHDDIVEAYKRSRREREEEQNKRNEALWDNHPVHSLTKPHEIFQELDNLLEQMNKEFYKLFGISKKQRWLIEDMLDVRMKLNEGKIAQEAVKAASREEITKFVSIFQEELDMFLDDTGRKKVHEVKVLYTKSSAVMIVNHLKHSTEKKPKIDEVKDSKLREQIDELQERSTERISQWMYYTRCLRIPEGRRTYIFKPRQRLYWLKSQALAEADEFIGEKLRG